MIYVRKCMCKKIQGGPQKCDIPICNLNPLKRTKAVNYHFAFFGPTCSIHIADTHWVSSKAYYWAS